MPLRLRKCVTVVVASEGIEPSIPVFCDKIRKGLNATKRDVEPWSRSGLKTGLPFVPLEKMGVQTPITPLNVIL
jgi:hypothetical protein